MPERFAQSALGHASLAVHREYAREGVAICPSLENYERNLVRLPLAEKKLAATSQNEGAGSDDFQPAILI